MNVHVAELPIGFLARLKAQTRPEHEAIEAALGLMGDGLTTDMYRYTLERFYGFYRPLEDRLWGVAGWGGRGLNLDERRKAPLLEIDLRRLGVNAMRGLPVCLDLPPHESVASCFGCLYVLEGATLGGQIITRHVRDRLGVTPESGGRFFHGYGERAGEMWQVFRAALTAFATTEQRQDEIVLAAAATFRTLHRWSQRGHPT